jgi:hypothetical protein
VHPWLARVFLSVRGRVDAVGATIAGQIDRGVVAAVERGVVGTSVRLVDLGICGSADGLVAVAVVRAIDCTGCLDGPVVILRARRN